MPPFVVGQQQGKQLARQQPGTQVQVRAPQQTQTRRVGSNAPNIQVRTRQPMMQRPAQPPRPMQPGGLGQQPPANVGVEKCISPDCGNRVTRKVDAMFIENGEGPYCRDCWSHLWVNHPWANVPDGPGCRMGVRFNPHELEGIQKLIMDTITQVGQQTGRFATPEQLDVVLSNIKKSMVCPTCHTNIPFTLDNTDFKIAGVNSPWPQGMPLPWMHQPGLAPQVRG